MENKNLPVTKHEGLFGKITLMFKKLFFKKGKVNIADKTNQSIRDNEQGSFIEKLQEKADLEGACKKDEIKCIVETIEQDANTLNNLTIEQLEDVNNYYTEQLEEVEKQISRIKKG